MALSLDQINSKKSFTANSEETKKNIRPWKSNDQFGKSFSGNLAVKKAREIANRNNELVESLRGDNASEAHVSSIEKFIRAKEEEFENLEKQEMHHRRIQARGGVIGKFKNLIFGH
ncbi:hypothetical protein [Bacteriovorax sp. Seq25_V]|uniref:hypothetical protein n=1 Tax=Bacteriovorax sp. Seq25_V TaxID=1201288 RepID=UPI00038A3FB6|nr:hypothetical protein [Bacteriovorax sp. Seq25_V]EQC45537.1 hypothetical protein M900_1920 [Bacteriovorax sp. Seq25_V]